MDIQTGVPGLCALIGRAASQTLIDSAIPLPDGRQAAEVLSAGTQLLMDEAVCTEGGVEARGRLSLQILCQTPGGEPFGFSASSSFTHTVEMAGAAAGMDASVRAQLLDCRCVAADGGLHLTAILELTALVTAESGTPLLTALPQQPDAELRMGKVERRRRVLLGEHVLHVAEEIAAPGVQTVLLYSGEAQPREISFSGSSASVECGLYVTVLTASAEGQLSLLTQILSCSDVFDAAYAEEAWAVAAVERLTVTAADANFGVADVEAAVRIRLYGVEAAETSVVLDAYDAAGSFDCEQSETPQLLCLGAEQKRFLLRENVQIPPHLPEAYRPICASATAAVTGTFDSEGALGVDAMLFATVLYQCDGGLLHSFTEDIPVQMVLSCAYTPDTLPAANCLSVQVSGSGRTPELQFAVQVHAERYDSVLVRAAVGVVPAAAAPDHSGLIVYCADAGDTLWSVGKRFHVPVAALADWNGTIAEPLSEGQPLLLVK